LLGELLEGKPHEQFLWGGAGNGRGSSAPRQSLTRQETFRFVKQSYNLEDVRVMKYQRLKNLVTLVTAVAYFAATFLGQQMKLRILCEKLLIISQRFFGAHTYRRTAFAGDYTGLEIRHTLIQRAGELQIPILDTIHVTRLLVRENVVFGAYGFDVEDGTRCRIHADAVITYRPMSPSRHKCRVLQMRLMRDVATPASLDRIDTIFTKYYRPAHVTPNPHLHRRRNGMGRRGARKGYRRHIRPRPRGCRGPQGGGQDPGRGHR